MSVRDVLLATPLAYTPHTGYTVQVHNTRPDRQRLEEFHGTREGEIEQRERALHVTLTELLHTHGVTRYGL